jgi:hypothetical protein
VADDARTEAHHRIAEAIRNRFRILGYPGEVTPLYEQLADAVLDMFPEVEFDHWGEYADGDGRQEAWALPNYIEPTHRRLVLRGASEPVIEERGP